MKRREAKFVHGSPRLAPEEMKTVRRVREAAPRPAGTRPVKTGSAAVGAKRTADQKPS